MNYKVQLTHQAESDVKALQKQYQTQVLKQIATLSTTVIPDGKRIKRLRGIKRNLYRLRSGDFRIIFSLGAETVTVHRVVLRRELKKIIAQLK